MNADDLDGVFGPGDGSASPEERARTSDRKFVRSQHQLSVYCEGAKGRVINAGEALRLFGWPKIQELADNLATPILSSSSEPYQTLERRASELNLDFRKTAKRAGWGERTIKDFQERKQVPFRNLERLAQLLALEENQLGLKPGSSGDRALGVRLRELRGRDAANFSDSVVLALSEAAWAIRTQVELAHLVEGSTPGVTHAQVRFDVSADYGNANRPAWRVGYELADKTREQLGIPAEQPIENLKDLIESRLGIPVVQVEINPKFAGATIANGNSRGIVVNLNGDNQNVWVRRMTLAHELGHLLWDPDSRLQRLIVDRYEDVEGKPRPHADFVEMRANAFAIQFLAPREVALDTYERAQGGAAGLTEVVDKFGISKTAARYHIQNAYAGSIDLSHERVDRMPSHEWEARESLAVPVFDPQTVPVSRRGRFGEFVLAALEAKFISDDSASSLFGCDPADLQRALWSVRNYVSG